MSQIWGWQVKVVGHPKSTSKWFSLGFVDINPLCSTGMLKDVEDELQRKVKVPFLASLWSSSSKEIITQVLNITMFGLHPQSTRSRQGEQRNPEVELEVRLAVSVPHFCIYVFILKICRTQSHRLNTNSVSSFYSVLSICLSERATRMTFLESGMFSWAIIVLEKNNQRRQINSKNRLFLGGQKLNLKKQT